MALNGVRSGLKLLSNSNGSLCRSVTRSVHSTSVKRMAGDHGHGHGHGSEPFYVHAKHMYNLDRMKHQKLKMTLGVWTCFTIGTAVPLIAVIFQQKKTASV